MYRRTLGPLHDLLAARHPGRCDDRFGGCRLHGREEAHAANKERPIVMLALEAERTGHAAAAGVEHRDRRTRDAAQERDAPCRRRRRLLMAVAMKEDRPVRRLCPRIY